MNSRKFFLSGFAASGLVVGMIATVLLAADSKPQAKAPKPAVAAPASAPDAHVIGHLERRGQRITIRAGADGPVYTVTSKDGKVLYRDLTVSQLKAQAPEIHTFVTEAMAAKGKAGAPNDARRTVER